MNDSLYGSFANERNRIYDLEPHSRFEERIGGVAAGALFRGISFQPFDLGREPRDPLLNILDGQQRQILSQFVGYFLSRFVIVIAGQASLLSFARL